MLTCSSLLHSNLYNGFQAEDTNVAIMLKLLLNTIQMAHWLARVEPDTVRRRTLHQTAGEEGEIAGINISVQWLACRV